MLDSKDCQYVDFKIKGNLIEELRNTNKYLKEIAEALHELKKEN
ncbi:hypothetical protein [Methanosphaera cuniculi]|uniref:Uncharacterized protein n=1 Tax=Methanosphaera cuniculi TaxID=1077256 RepID=A0A2V2BQD9_9EURY|nr:hypothetical protein [Methanosphaera cuniculi]PWL07763.1 hypothetical protein MSCUN_12940 [Methanosphaera cuniculi]